MRRRREQEEEERRKKEEERFKNQVCLCLRIKCIGFLGLWEGELMLLWSRFCVKVTQTFDLLGL